jgi:predicted HicB family RNase H-like nuclease
MLAECRSVIGAVAERTENLKVALAEGASEPLRMITVRLPMSLHEQLKADAFSRKKSLNQHCIDKLLGIAAVDSEEAA